MDDAQMNLLLDTCAIIWCVSDPDQLSDPAKSALVDSAARVYVSAISCAEIACLCDAGKLEITSHWRRWFDLAIHENGWGLRSVDLETVQEAYALPGDFHRDPADRFIVATARLNRFHVLTADQKILDYPHVQSLW